MSEKEARCIAIKQLSKRSMHSQELIRALRKKGVLEPFIETVIEECRANKWLQDALWVKGFVERLRQQGKSSLEILAKCHSRGISRQEIEDELRNGNIESLKALIPRRYRELLDKQIPIQKRQKSLGALYRKGFSISDIQSALKEIASGNNDL